MKPEKEGNSRICVSASAILTEPAEMPAGGQAPRKSCTSAANSAAGVSAVAVRSHSFAADDCSPFYSLKKKTLRSAVLAVKDRFRGATPRRIESAQSLEMKAAPAQDSTEDRLALCRKELDVSLRYLQNVISKEKLVMLAGSASVVLDTVLKLLLVLNEKNSSFSQHKSKPELESSTMLPLYDKLYLTLAELLKYTDVVAIKGKVEISNEEVSIGDLCEDLKEAVESLIEKSNHFDSGLNKSEKSKVKINRSNSSESQASGTGSDLCNDDADLELIRSLDRSDEITCQKERPEAANNGPSAAVPPPKPPHPSLIFFKPNTRSVSPNLPPGTYERACENPLNGSYSPPSADSGVDSLNTTENSALGEKMPRDSLLISSTHSENRLNEEEPDISVNNLYAKLNLPIFDVESPNVSELGQEKDATAICTPTVNVSDSFETDEHSTSEEKKELRGNTLIKTKKITTKQVVRQTVVTTKQSLIYPCGVDSTDNLKLDLNENVTTADLIEKLRLQGGISGDGGEIKITETQNFLLSGSGQYEKGEKVLVPVINRFPLNRSQHSFEGGVKNPSIDISSDSVVSNSATVGSPVSNYNERPISVYENEKLRLVDESSVLKLQQNCMHQSCSVQSISRKALINGRLVASQSQERGMNSSMALSKSSCFQNGVLTETDGQGSFEQDSWSKNNLDLKVDDQYDLVCDNPLRSGDKLSGVLSYVRIFGSSQPVNQADFCAISLASYVHLRERWRSHEESTRKKAFTFQFSTNNSSTNGCQSQSSSSSSSKQEDRTTSVSRDLAPFNDRQPWMELDKSATTPRTLSSRNVKTDLQNIMDLLELNDKLNFPHRFFGSSKPEQKFIQFQKKCALNYVNFLDEVDVKRFLVCKVDQSEDGPDFKGGSMDALVVYATHGSSNHKGLLFQDMFVNTYRTFLNSLELLKKLIYRYEKFNELSSNEDVGQKEFINDYRKVVKDTFALIVSIVEDLSTAELTDDVFNVLRDFLYRMVFSGQLNLARFLRRGLTKRLEAKQNYGADSSLLIFSPFSPKTLRNIRVVDFRSIALAEQFTYLDWYYFKKIEISEMLLWAQQQTEEHSPNLATFTSHFNKMSYWVRTRILTCADSKERETVFAKFLKVMRHLQQLGNFNSLFAMLSALDSGSIRRLDWPKWLTESLAEYSVLTDSSQSFKAYRSALADSKPPCLPYVGVILQDLTFVHIGNPNFVPESQCDGRRDLINLTKRWQQHTILENMRRFKSWPYNVKKNEQILAFVNLFEDHLSEEELWEKSEKIKPRISNKR